MATEEQQPTLSRDKVKEALEVLGLDPAKVLSLTMRPHGFFVDLMPDNPDHSRQYLPEQVYIGIVD